MTQREIGGIRVQSSFFFFSYRCKIVREVNWDFCCIKNMYGDNAHVPLNKLHTIMYGSMYSMQFKNHCKYWNMAKIYLTIWIRIQQTTLQIRSSHTVLRRQTDMTNIKSKRTCKYMHLCKFYRIITLVTTVTSES